MANDSVFQPPSSSGSAPAISASGRGRGGDSRSLDESDSPRELIVRAIIRGLYDGRFKPGQRLVEAELTAAHGVSRGPVREAFNRLAATGVVDLTLQRGAQVRMLKIEEAIDILVVVDGLIRIAARLAAMRIQGPGATARMVAALEAVDSFDPACGTAEYAIARDNFYGTLTSIAGNVELRRILPTVQIHLIRVQFRAIMSSAGRHRHDEYKRIADAVLAGRPRAAEAAVGKHLGRAIAALTSFRDANHPGSSEHPRKDTPSSH